MTSRCCFFDLISNASNIRSHHARYLPHSHHNKAVSVSENAAENESTILFSPAHVVSPPQSRSRTSAVSLEHSGTFSEPPCDALQTSPPQDSSEVMSVSNYEDSGVGNSVGHNGCNSSCTLDSLSPPPVSPNYHINYSCAALRQHHPVLVTSQGTAPTHPNLAQPRHRYIQTSQINPVKNQQEIPSTRRVETVQTSSQLMTDNQFCPIFSPTPSIGSSVLEPLHVETSRDNGNARIAGDGCTRKGQESSALLTSAKPTISDDNKYGTVPIPKSATKSDRKAENIAESDSSRKLMQSYKEISSEIDLTEDMERRFEEELAALRLRRSFLKHVQEKTEAIISNKPKESSSGDPNPEKSVPSQEKHRNYSASSLGNESSKPSSAILPAHDTQKSNTLSLKTNKTAIARDSLSSPGVQSIISAQNATFPPGFDGSSVPLKPTAALFQPVKVKERDPFDPPEKLPSFLVPTKAPLDGFVEGQLISLSISSGDCSVHEQDDLDNDKVMEELKIAFELHQKEVQSNAGSRDDDLEDAETETKTKSDDRKGSREEIASRIALMEDASNTPSLMEKFLNSQCDVSDDFVSNENSQPIRDMSAFRNDMVSPVLTETSGEYKLSDHPNRTVDRTETGTFTDARDNQKLNQSAPVSQHQPRTVTSKSPSACQGLTVGGGIQTRQLRSFEEKNSIIQNLSASSPDTNIAISQYRGRNELGEEDELLTVEAELPCDYPSLPPSQDRVYSYCLGSYQPHSYVYQPRLDTVLDYDEENTGTGTPVQDIRPSSASGAAEETRQLPGATTDGGASTAEEAGSFGSGQSKMATGCESSSAIPASPHFSAVDYKMCDSDHNTQYEIEILGKELTKLRLRLERLSKKQKAATAYKDSQAKSTNDGYQHQLKFLQDQIQALEQFSKQVQLNKPMTMASAQTNASKTQTGESSRYHDRHRAPQGDFLERGDRKMNRQSIQSQHEEMKNNILSEIHFLRQLNLSLLKEKFNTDTSNVNDTDTMERILQIADEVELFQKRVMTLEDKLSNIQMWLMELENEKMIGSDDWIQLKYEASILLLEAAHERQTAHVSALRRRSTIKSRKQRRSASFAGETPEIRNETVERATAHLETGNGNLQAVGSIKRKSKSHRRKHSHPDQISIHQTLGQPTNRIIDTDGSPVWIERREDVSKSSEDGLSDKHVGSRTFPRRHRQRSSKATIVSKSGHTSSHNLDAQAHGTAKHVYASSDSEDQNKANTHEAISRRRSSGGSNVAKTPTNEDKKGPQTHAASAESSVQGATSQVAHKNLPLKEQESLQSDFIPIGETATPRSSTSSLVTSSEAMTAKRKQQTENRQPVTSEGSRFSVFNVPYPQSSVASGSINSVSSTFSPPITVQVHSMRPTASNTLNNRSSGFKEKEKIEHAMGFGAQTLGRTQIGGQSHSFRAETNFNHSHKTAYRVAHPNSGNVLVADSSDDASLYHYSTRRQMDQHRRVKPQKQGLTVVEKGPAYSSHHLTIDELDPWRASPSPAMTQENSTNVSRQLSPETTMEARKPPPLFNPHLAMSRESLSSVSRGHTTDYSPMSVQMQPHSSSVTHYAPAGVIDPRMTPIYVDGGNIISTKGGLYRLKMPVNDLDGNDRRRKERSRFSTILQTPDRSHSPGFSQNMIPAQSDFEDDIDPGSKSDSELLPSMRAAMEKRVKFSDGPPQISKIPTKRKKSLKNRFQKFTKELELHLKSGAHENNPMSVDSQKAIAPFNMQERKTMSLARTDEFRTGRSLDDLNGISGSVAPSQQQQSAHNLITSPSSSSILSSNAASRQVAPDNSGSKQNLHSPGVQQPNTHRQQTVFETSFVGKEPKINQQPTVTTRLSAVPCYYRTLPDNKIQVMYPDSNQVFQFSYSKTVPPISKKSSMQLIQQVQPDGKLSEEKLYFFDPIQLDEADTRLRYHEQIMNQGRNSPKKHLQSGTAGKKQPWIFKKTIAVKERMKPTKHKTENLTQN